MSDSTSTKTRVAYTASWWQIHAWAIGGIAGYFLYEQFYLILNIHTTIFKVSPFWVGIILAMPRIFDGLLDPLIGHWSDNLKSRFGRRRPFMLVAALVGAGMATGMFWMSPEWAQWIKCVMLTFCAVTLFTATGTYEMSHTALGFELSEDYAHRSKVFATRGIYTSAMGCVGGYVIGMSTDLPGTVHHLLEEVQRPIMLIGDLWCWMTGAHAWAPFLVDGWDHWSARLHLGFSSAVYGFRATSGIIAGGMIISVLFPLFFSRERYVHVNRKHVNLWGAIKATLKCRPFVVILIMNVTTGLSSLPRSLFFFVGVYYVVHQATVAESMASYSNTMGGDFAVVGLALSFVVYWVIKPLTNRLGKRTIFIAGAAMGLIQAIGWLFVVRPGHLQLWFWYNVAFLPLTGLISLNKQGLLPDICDIDELENGQRREGMFTAMQSFVNKMEISVMVVLTGLFLDFSGFDADMGIHQDPQVLHRMFWMAFGPMVGITLISLIASCFMPLTKEMMAKVRAELDARHAAAGTVEDSDPAPEPAP